MSKIDATTPLFIVGMHRSGTTWVANLLCNHSQIYGVQAAEHYGIVESWFFSHLDGRYGDITHSKNYADLMDTFTRTAIFRCSSVDAAQLREFAPANYADFFHQFMMLAAQAPVRYWLEKTPVHTLFLDRLIAYYPMARFVAIERPVEAVTRSSLTLKQKNNKLQNPTWSDLAYAAWKWHLYQKSIRHFSQINPDRFMTLQFTDLKKDPQREVQRVLTFLGLEWESRLLEIPFEQNTSFGRTPERKFLDSTWSKSLLKLFDRTFGLLPYSLYNWRFRQQNSYLSRDIPFLEGTE